MATEQEEAPTSGIHLPGLPSLTVLAKIHSEFGVFLNVAPKVVHSPLGMLFPEIRRLDTILPALQAIHDLVGNLESAGGDPSKMISVFNDHFASVVAATKAALSKVGGA
jgi:hypothetical protein